jgi:hypothetical protein
MIQIQKIKRPDTIGALASAICLIHCVVTPFIFIAKACSITCCADSPIWWQAIDYVFLVVSFIAIYFSTKGSTKVWIQIAFWTSWLFLLIALITGSLELRVVPNLFAYVPALAIIGLHLYNMKYCPCPQGECHVQTQ